MSLVQYLVFSGQDPADPPDARVHLCLVRAGRRRYVNSNRSAVLADALHGAVKSGERLRELHAVDWRVVHFYVNFERS